MCWEPSLSPSPASISSYVEYNLCCRVGKRERGGRKLNREGEERSREGRRGEEIGEEMKVEERGERRGKERGMRREIQMGG